MGSQSTKINGHQIHFIENRKHNYLGDIKVYQALGHPR